jgi:hypothetical protein
MSNISYIEEQLRNLGDYTGDGDILGPDDMDIAKDILTNTQYNSLKLERLALLLYSTKDENEREENNRFKKITSDAIKLKNGNLLGVDCNLSNGCNRDCMIGSGLNIDGVGSGLSKDGNCMYGSDNCFSIGLDINNNEFGSSSIQDGIQKYNINYIQAYGEGIQCPTGSNTITYGPCKNPCPIDCIVGSGSWGSCSIDSSGSSIVRTQTRNEEVIQFPGYGGSSCRALNEFTSDCPIAIETDSIYFSKISNIFYSHIPIFNIVIEYEKTSFNSPTFNIDNI